LKASAFQCVILLFRVVWPSPRIQCNLLEKKTAAMMAATIVNATASLESSFHQSSLWPVELQIRMNMPISTKRALAVTKCAAICQTRI